MAAYFEKGPAELLKLRGGGGGMSCLPFSQDSRLKLAATKMRHQVNGPLPFEIEQPLLIVSSWDRPKYEDLIEANDTWFVSDRFKTLIESTAAGEVEFFPAFIENLDREKSKDRPRVSINDMTPGHAGGGSRIEGYWWMNLWALEDVLDRQASVGQWHDGGRELVRNILDGAAGEDSLGRLPGSGRKIILKAKPSKPIFQIKGLQNFLFVSEDFASLLESNGLDLRVTIFNQATGE
ncbi:imm11 family protein [Caulobacter soli]|uniref:imm11 family protein n=1 Tax=Caulobacter soli TaxID=2708539 RepID=UPI0013EBD734|nr:DUF1629 domain-containing protein [Caulobacter soli]